MTIQHTQTQALSLLMRAGILPVITVHSVDQAHHLAQALTQGGLSIIELTLRTPIALAAITAIKHAFPTMVVGAGTVTTPAHVQQAIDAGADFLVTPGTPTALADCLASAPIPAVPGAATATELLTLMEFGFRACKLFPATAVGGLSLIKSLAGPLAQLKLCPTGGITAANAAEFLGQPNVACVGGSWMVNQEWITQHEWATITQTTARAVQIAQAVRAAQA